MENSKKANFKFLRIALFILPLILIVTVHFAYHEGYFSTSSTAKNEFASAPENYTDIDLNEDAMINLVRKILVENPEILAEAQESLELYTMVQEQQQTSMALAENKNRLDSGGNEIILGNPDGKITLIEFYDYNCAYCKRSHSVKMELIEKHKDLRIVLKDYPILSQDSVNAAVISVIVSQDENADFTIFHDALMRNPGRATQNSAMRAAEVAGADLDQITQALRNVKDTNVETKLNETRDVARSLGINATPSYIIGDEIVPGAIPIEQFEQRIAELRLALENE